LDTLVPWPTCTIHSTRSQPYNLSEGCFLRNGICTVCLKQKTKNLNHRFLFPHACISASQQCSLYRQNVFTHLSPLRKKKPRRHRFFSVAHSTCPFFFSPPLVWGHVTWQKAIEGIDQFPRRDGEDNITFVTMSAETEQRPGRDSSAERLRCESGERPRRDSLTSVDAGDALVL
jgi:hypothetical protein